MMSDFRQKIRDKIKERWSDWRGDYDDGIRWPRYVAIAIAGYLLVAMVMGVIWSIEPDEFDVRTQAFVRVKELDADIVTGAVTTATLINVSDTLLHKNGGYLSNDIFPPGVWLDNQPHWEYGVLIQVRDLSKAMRESFSRSQSQSTEDKDLAIAESRFNFDHNSWVVPATESQYREGMEFFGRYLARLVDAEKADAQFYARADNLRYWLSTVETRLGSLSQRLSASVGQRRINTDLAGDNSARQATAAPREMEVKTPWNEVDDVFYEARGSAWALLHFLKAIEVDFAEVLEKKNARVSLQQIIRELEATQVFVYSPVILNGSGFGVFANHSLVMASYISRANAALIDLRELLSKG
ncbi:DUF2333 family protein [Marinibactrum halimedae]|uniref:DUF2333 family protein n=1 Tax=Marinibactrum halimedae TaxID=1444977 RepID=A0AA37T8D7_9GAMM|nr:DUF2333 family protein [Marinibactrum halimedae]MCD9459947.1 DUF2333 family protein [Marinibactrum halimedae]GLS25195.1 hypothetical protein GCM10007877_09090 [Marinibactrum halimedae]